MVSPDQEYQAGLGPTDPLAGALGGLGLGFNPQPLPTMTLDPSQLGNAPSDSQIGSGLLQRLDEMQAGVAT